MKEKLKLFIDVYGFACLEVAATVVALSFLAYIIVESGFGAVVLK